jgi:hypothetical protein
MPVMAMAPKSNPARVAGKYLMTFSLLVLIERSQGSRMSLA